MPILKVDKEKTGGKTWNKAFVALATLTLLQDGKAYGNQLTARIEDLTEGLYRPNPNTLYPVLRMLEEDKHVIGRWEQPDVHSKRIYEITDEGREYIKELQSRLEEHLDYLERFATISRERFFK